MSGPPAEHNSRQLHFKLSDLRGLESHEGAGSARGRIINKARFEMQKIVAVVAHMPRPRPAFGALPAA